MRLKAIRPHFVRGEPVAKGDEYDIDDRHARELIWANKAELAPVKAPKKKTASASEKPAPMSTKSAAGLVPGGAEEEKEDAKQ